MLAETEDSKTAEAGEMPEERKEETREWKLHKPEPRHGEKGRRRDSVMELSDKAFPGETSPCTPDREPQTGQSANITQVQFAEP